MQLLLDPEETIAELQHKLAQADPLERAYMATKAARLGPVGLDLLAIISQNALPVLRRFTQTEIEWIEFR